MTRAGVGGSLPAELSSMDALQQLRLSGNSFSGALPNEWSSLSSLTVLLVDNNQISGAHRAPVVTQGHKDSVSCRVICLSAISKVQRKMVHASACCVCSLWETPGFDANHDAVKCPRRTLWLSAWHAHFGRISIKHKPCREVLCQSICLPAGNLWGQNSGARTKLSPSFSSWMSRTTRSQVRWATHLRPCSYSASALA